MSNRKLFCLVALAISANGCTQTNSEIGAARLRKDAGQAFRKFRAGGDIHPGGGVGAFFHEFRIRAGGLGG